jgi:hypothetical protein
MPTLIVAVAIVVGLIYLLFHFGVLKSNPDGLDPRLLEATRGDCALAQRLLMQARLKYPDKSDRWYVEKIIYDLGRDRGIIKAPSSGFRLRWNRGTREDLRQNLMIAGAFLWVISSLQSLFRNFRG